MLKQHIKKLQPICCLLVIAIASCAGNYWDIRTETAHRLAAPSFMLEKDIKADPFLITSFERVREAGENADIYIEGDGMAWLSRNEPSLDPTPTNPVALHLATRDKAMNVIYLARPCQYSRMVDGRACDQSYWTSKRFAPEVIDSMSKALDDIKLRHHIKGFNLVGYSGGAAVVVMLAARRDDVLSFRTVAGNLDTDLFSKIHNISPLNGSLNPVNEAAKTVGIPQHHFIGKWDTVVTPALYDSYHHATGDSPCVRATIIDDSDHNSGWVDKWPDMMKEPLDCHAD